MTCKEPLADSNIFATSDSWNYLMTIFLQMQQTKQIRFPTAYFAVLMSHGAYVQNTGLDPNLLLQGSSTCAGDFMLQFQHMRAHTHASALQPSL